MDEFVNLKVSANAYDLCEVVITVDFPADPAYQGNALDALNRAYAEARRRIEAPRGA